MNQENRREMMDRSKRRKQGRDGQMKKGLTVGMEELGHELHSRRLVRVLLAEVKTELEGPALPRRIVWTEDHSTPVHDVILMRSSCDALRRICLEALEVTHQATLRRCRLRKVGRSAGMHEWIDMRNGSERCIESSMETIFTICDVLCCEPQGARRGLF